MFVCDFGEWKWEHNVKQGKFLSVMEKRGARRTNTKEKWDKRKSAVLKTYLWMPLGNQDDMASENTQWIVATLNKWRTKCAFKNEITLNVDEK